MQRRLDPETGVNKLFENVLMSGGYSQFFLGGGTNFRHFSSVLLADLISSKLSTKNDSWGVLGHAPPENFGKFAYCNGYFIAF